MKANNESYIVKGYKNIKGEITCYGTKNYITKALVASILTDEKTIFYNVPPIGDVDITIDMLIEIGADIDYDRELKTLEIDSSKINSNRVTSPQTGTNRIPILLLSAMINRFNEVYVPQVGGCDIGARSVNFHINSLERFGAVCSEDSDGFRASKIKKLQGTSINLSYPSVGATETFLFLSVLSQGYSTIYNAAVEPEIIDLITMLRSMGAIIYTTSSRTIHVEGVDKLHGVKNYVNGDRIEAASWACLAASTNGDLVVKGVSASNLGNFLPSFFKAGGGFEVINSETIRFFKRRELTPILLETDVFPGFSTDWQQPFAIMLTQANGISIIHDTVYENRFQYLNQLVKLGANIQLSTECLGGIKCRFKGEGHLHSAIISGKSIFKGGELTVPDLRAGLAYIIAGAISQSEVQIKGINLIERGYGDIEKKLQNIGLNIVKQIDS